MNPPNLIKGLTVVSAPVTDQVEAPEKDIGHVEIFDSPPPCLEIVILEGFLNRLGYNVKVTYFKSHQGNKECGYRAIVSAFHSCRPEGFLNFRDQEELLKTGELVKFFNNIINHEQSEAVCLSDDNIKHIVGWIEFLQNNFYLNSVLDAHALYRTLKSIDVCYTLMRNAESHVDFSSFACKSLIHMIDDVKGCTKEGTFKGLLKTILYHMKTENLAKLRLLDDAYGSYICTRLEPGWFDDVYGFRAFQEYTEGSRSRPTDQPFCAIVNTGDRPNGRHWFTVVTYKDTEEKNRITETTRTFYQ